MFKKIAIIGVGLIGGSIGLAVKEKKLAKEVIGIGRRRSSIRNALKKGAVDRATLDLREGVKEADLIIVATSVDKVMTKIKEAAPCAKAKAIIIDVNGTKKNVVEYADKIMPKRICFVGTHPLAGLDQSGVLFADSRLFDNTVCIITPTRHTNKTALRKIIRFWERLSARVKILSPQAHDIVVARVSHLPHILSYNLCSIISSKDIKMAGSGFKDTTRIAKSNPDMWADIFLQNRSNLLRSIDDFERSLKVLKSYIIRNKKEQLLKRLAIAKGKRESIG